MIEEEAHRPQPGKRSENSPRGDDEDGGGAVVDPTSGSPAFPGPEVPSTDDGAQGTGAGEQ